MYRFKRGKSFGGIKEPWGVKKHSDLRQVSAKKRKLQYHYLNSQEDLFDTNDYYEFGLKGRLGKILEVFDSAIRGGTTKIQRRISKSNSNGNGIICIPDHMGLNGEWAIDTKGVAPSQALEIKTAQFGKYMALQIGNYFPQHPEISFDIFRHDIKGLESQFNTSEIDGLVKELAGNVRYGISLPISVLYKLHGLDKVYPGKGEHKLVSRCESNVEGDPFSRLKNKRIRFYSNVSGKKHSNILELIRGNIILRGKDILPALE